MVKLINELWSNTFTNSVIMNQSNFKNTALLGHIQVNTKLITINVHYEFDIFLFSATKK